MDIILRPNQEQAKKDSEKFIFDSAHKRGVIVAPVATGKSVLVASISEISSKKCLVVQPNYELLMQNIEKARCFNMDASIYSASAGQKDISNLTYATPLSLISEPDKFKDFDIVIIDEADFAMSNTLSGGKVSDKGKFNQFLDYINPNKVIGLTATPIQLVTTGAGSEIKMMTRSRRSYWNQADIFHVTQIQDIKEKYWADIKIEVVEGTEKYLRLNSTGNEFTNESIIKNYKENNTNNKILDQYENLINKGKKSILTFVPSVLEGESLKRLNKDFEFIYDKTPKKERAAIIKAFKRGDIPNIINCLVLGVGFDHPELDAIIMGRNTNSFRNYYQWYGRVVRPIIMPDGSIFKKKGTVIDLTGNYKRFGSVENITFEKQEYTKGWAMWNEDKIMTGYPFENWDMPTREEVEKVYNQSLIKGKKPEEIKFPFGKHKGKDLSNVFKFDKGYLKWLVTNKEFEWKTDNMKQLKVEIENLFKKEILN